jgi:ferredoxin
LSGKWRIKVDPQLCQASHMCVGIAPAVFEPGPGGVTRPRQDVVDSDDDVLDAAECCPVSAITITELETGRLLSPQ